jgi:SapC
LDYERPIPLSGDVLKQRIFSPIAYAMVRRANIIAIAAVEAPRYAAHFPIAWRKRATGFELVILRSLLADGRGHVPGTQTALGFLPALARAYPFLYDPAREPAAGRAKFVDSAIADEPGDLGAPICYVDGRPTKATTQRIGMLDSLAPAFSQTAAITQQLAKADLFEPWPLHFENVEGQTIDVEGLWIIKQNAAASGVFAPIMRAHGLLAADLIGLHRISLFRAGTLLAQTRSALKASAAAPATQKPVGIAALQPDLLATALMTEEGADA